MTASIEPFHAIEVSLLARALQAQGRSIIHMEFGQPSTGAPRAAIEVAHHVLDTDGLDYWESPDLKQRLARYYLETYGVEISPEQVLLTCGASPALVLALISSFSPGDTIALARPGYVAYRNNIKALHMIPVELECGIEQGFQLTADHLARLDPAPKGVIIASPANPTGTIIAKDEMAAIAKLCQERQIRIISDEIYHGLSYEGQTHSILEFEPKALVVNSFSKYFSMVGWRLGWLVVPKDHIQTARAYIGNLFLTSPSLSQYAGLAALDSQDELQAHISVYRQNRSLLMQALPDLGLTTIAPPDGAFYIYADISHLSHDSLQFCKDLLNATGVTLAPGIDFDPVHGHDFIRFSFAVSTAELKEAIERMIPFFAHYGASK